jgi:hypothetical protein
LLPGAKIIGTLNKETNKIEYNFNGGERVIDEREIKTPIIEEKENFEIKPGEINEN